jgi:monofunctional biosynthetic peptidoglycan transglycosylase
MLGFRLAVAFVVLSVLGVLVLRFVPPPASAFMVQRQVEAWWDGDKAYRTRHDWIGWEEISPELRIAVVASEDQKFPTHHGFDWDAIESALEHNREGRRVHGASTISQQTAKNLFLWPGRSWLRKGCEAWFTVLIETLLPKRRVLELYLNVAEFGDGIYGAEAASQAFFRKPASRLTRREAALLAAVLPSPRKLHPDRPSRYVLAAAAWVERQVEQLGGPGYLAELEPKRQAAVRPRRA